uniref:Uncharacterized protein n=1 Tax=Panagrolaimus sp. PS1159 TaxID=55785 RepID=A0AC35GEH2_9BILA
MYSNTRRPISTPSTSTNGKFTQFFDSLIKLASLKSCPRHSVDNLERNIEDFVRHHISAEEFVIGLGHIFGSYQPHLIGFLKKAYVQPSTSAPFATAICDDFVEPIKPTKPFRRSLPSQKAESPKPPAYATPFRDKFKSSPENIPSFNEKPSAKPTNIQEVPSTLQQKREPSPKPSFPVISVKGLIKANRLIKHCQFEKKNIESISQDAVAHMEKFLLDEFHEMFNDVINVAKARQSVPSIIYVDSNNSKAQLPSMDSFLKRLQASTSEEGIKVLGENNNRKRAFVESNIDEKKRYGEAASQSSNESPPKSDVIDDETFQIIDEDVLHCIFDNKKFVNSWVYENAQFLNLFAGFRKR